MDKIEEIAEGLVGRLQYEALGRLPDSPVRKLLLEAAERLRAYEVMASSDGEVSEAMIEELVVKITEHAVMELDADEENTLQIEGFGNAVEKEIRAALTQSSVQPDERN